MLCPCCSHCTICPITGAHLSDCALCRLPNIAHKPPARKAIRACAAVATPPILPAWHMGGVHPDRIAQQNTGASRMTDERDADEQSEGVVLISHITCPACGHRSSETMPAAGYLHRYVCRACGKELRPKRGECCVFCAYGSWPCPQVQREGAACCAGDDSTIR